MLSYFLAFATLVLAVIAGSFFASFLHIPLPAALIGLLLLLAGLGFLKRIPNALLVVCQFILKYMTLFFIPATVSILAFQSQFAQYGLIILAALMISTFVSIGVSALICQKWVEGNSDEQ